MPACVGCENDVSLSQECLCEQNFAQTFSSGPDKVCGMDIAIPVLIELGRAIISRLRATREELARMVGVADKLNEIVASRDESIAMYSRSLAGCEQERNAARQLIEQHALTIGSAHRDSTELRIALERSRTDHAALKLAHDQLCAWRPISEAPKEYNRVLLYREGEDPYIGCRDFSGMWQDDNGNNMIDNPTHWQPLPQPPKEQA